VNQASKKTFLNYRQIVDNFPLAEPHLRH